MDVTLAIVAAAVGYVLERPILPRSADRWLLTGTTRRKEVIAIRYLNGSGQIELGALPIVYRDADLLVCEIAPERH